VSSVRTSASSGSAERSTRTGPHQGPAPPISPKLSSSSIRRPTGLPPIERRPLWNELTYTFDRQCFNSAKRLVLNKQKRQKNWNKNRCFLNRWNEI
jgi:hypothetical protein